MGAGETIKHHSSSHQLSLLEIFDAEVMIYIFGFYAAEWNSLGGDTMFVLSGDEDR